MPNTALYCEQARMLLAQPGLAATPPALLQAHLVGCRACRGYQAMQNGAADRLLHDLLFLAPVARAPHNPARFVRYALVGLLAVLLLAGSLAIGRVALALFTIRQSVQALIVAPTHQSGSAAPQRSQPIGATPALPTVAARAPRWAQAAVSPPDWRVADATHSLPLVPASHNLPTMLPPATPSTPPAPDAGGALTLLLIGSDQRLGEGGSSRGDAIMVARIEPASRRVALLSLTRDLMADIPGHGYQRINSANVYGGPELTRQTVANLLGIPIDYYLYVNFEGFITVVDALGGVVVNVDKEIYQPGWELHFMPGPTQMDGLTALRYSRIRMPDSDYERIKRQQSVIVAIGERLREYASLQSIGDLEHLAQLSQVLHGYVQTDLPEARMLALAWALRGLDPATIEHHSLEGYMVSTHVVPGDPYAQVANPGTIDMLVQYLLGELR